MTESRDKLQGVLDGLVQQGGITWVGLVSRDGIPVIESKTREIAKETFSAMTATLMGAAEIALGELGAGRLRRVVAEADHKTMVVVGVTDELLLVAVLDREARLDAVVPRVDAVVARIPSAIAGG